MCIIVAKNRGYALPQKEILQRCFINNPDGAGFMYADANGVHIRKGFMTFDAFYTALNAEIKQPKKYAVVMHFRISTQGGKKPELTHPYPLTHDMNNMRMLSCKTNIGVAHNGVIYFTSDGASDYNDTMRYICEYLTLLVKPLDTKFYKNIKLCELIEQTIDASRLAILSSDSTIVLLGNGWIHDKKHGLAYSNTSYEAYTYKRGYSYMYDFDDFDGWHDKKYNTAPASTADASHNDAEVYDPDAVAFCDCKFFKLDDNHNPIYKCTLYDSDADVIASFTSDSDYYNFADPQAVLDDYNEYVHQDEKLHAIKGGVAWL